jgi:hypothetical protein
MILNIMFVISIILYVFAYNINQTRTFHIQQHTHNKVYKKHLLILFKFTFFIFIIV